MFVAYSAVIILGAGGPLRAQLPRNDRLLAPEARSDFLGDDPNPPQGDMLCGPRCARAVLHWYGMPAELDDLVVEIQDPDWRKGATLDSVRNALERRGVRTLPVRVERGVAITWPSPLVAHIGTDVPASLGHFVVQLPANRAGSSHIYCGLAGIQETSERDFATRRSDIVLLTSLGAIEPPRQLRSIAWCSLSVLLGATLGLSLFSALASRRTQSAVFRFAHNWRKS